MTRSSGTSLLRLIAILTTAFTAFALVRIYLPFNQPEAIDYLALAELSVPFVLMALGCLFSYEGPCERIRYHGAILISFMLLGYVFATLPDRHFMNFLCRGISGFESTPANSRSLRWFFSYCLQPIPDSTPIGSASLWDVLHSQDFRSGPELTAQVVQRATLMITPLWGLLWTLDLIGVRSLNRKIQANTAL